MWCCGPSIVWIPPTLLPKFLDEAHCSLPSVNSAGVPNRYTALLWCGSSGLNLFAMQHSLMMLLAVITASLPGSGHNMDSDDGAEIKLLFCGAVGPRLYGSKLFSLFVPANQPRGEPKPDTSIGILRKNIAEMRSNLMVLEFVWIFVDLSH
ncbi:hypothetical protein Nepgr_007969 [Nepenthes gracilis]|uniref:Uncharacterized protein n=1 Tax=Nepenthes gracilis TaxID=150966 RepID=A0AAD3S886_NEPGR|nr:hypothetical protein Nepgr_007969 [Nepenthes gracilis]